MKNRGLSAGTPFPQKHDRSANPLLWRESRQIQAMCPILPKGSQTNRRSVTVGAANQVGFLVDPYACYGKEEAQPTVPFCKTTFSFSESADVLSPTRTNNVVFSDAVIVATSKADAIGETTDPDSFVLELFGEQTHRPLTASWLPGILSTAKTDRA